MVVGRHGQETLERLVDRVLAVHLQIGRKKTFMKLLSGEKLAKSFCYCLTPAHSLDGLPKDASTSP